MRELTEISLHNLFLPLLERLECKGHGNGGRKKGFVEGKGCKCRKWDKFSKVANFKETYEIT